ncbi:MAG: hypothetical protein OXU36_13770 [Candidatus Poribacteria bacterium]|nr:hypothetical protein [Candidatus Poribacteria bacterium]
MAQLSNQEIASLKNLLEKDMDRIEARLDANEKETASIRTELKRVKREVINILGLDEEKQPTPQKRRTTSNPVSRSSRRGRIPS